MQTLWANYELTGSAFVPFELPAKKAKPNGRLPVTSAKVRTNLADLAQTTGVLHFDLAELEMLDTEGSPAPTYSEQARDWLGLGMQAPAEERKRNRYARFEVTELRSLSALLPHAGAALEAHGTKAARKISATARGRLHLRGFSVEHELELSLVFHYEGKALPSERPQRVSLESRVPLRIGRAEHGIFARTPEGHLAPSLSPGSDEQVGGLIFARGQLALQLVTTPP